MMNLSPELVTILLFGGVLLGVFIGLPIAFVVGGVALTVGFLVFGSSVYAVLYQRLFSLVHNYTLVAVPLFIFMGIMLEHSGIADTMFDVLYLWLGRLPGSLAIVTIMMGTILAACVAIIGASISMLALTALPPMMKRGYDKALACGAVISAGCLGILIPPSIMLVIYGPMAGISVGKLFMAAIFPGLLLSTLYVGYVAIRCALQPSMGPPQTAEEHAQVSLGKKVFMLVKSLFPPAIVILSVLGVIFFGIAPPTEAAAIGAFVATLLAIAYRKFTWKVLGETTLRTFRLTSMILLIGGLSFAFVGVFIRAGCDRVISETILGMPGGRWGAFSIIMLIIFVLGFFIDWIGILFIMIPIISPVGKELGFDPLWFGLMIMVNLQTAFMTPPLAQGIFFLRGAAPPALGIKIADIIRGCVPFIVLVLVGLGLCVAFPEIITWLPGKMIK
jgi:tripartite ATP-independent transporter DctM subunit